MPRCTVYNCKKFSGRVNLSKDGISFHHYPKDPKVKQEWIKATGKHRNWFPTKNSVICSVHFETKCFQTWASRHRRLFEWAVPTLKLRMVWEDNPEFDFCQTSMEQKAKKRQLDSFIEYINDSSDDGQPENNQETADEIDNGLESSESETDTTHTEKVFVKRSNAKQKPKNTNLSKRFRKDPEVLLEDTEEFYEFGKFVAEQLMCLDIEEARAAQKEIKELLMKVKRNIIECSKPNTSVESVIDSTIGINFLPQFNPISSSSVSSLNGPQVTLTEQNSASPTLLNSNGNVSASLVNPPLVLNVPPLTMFPVLNVDIEPSGAPVGYILMPAPNAVVNLPNHLGDTKGTAPSGSGISTTQAIQSTSTGTIVNTEMNAGNTKINTGNTKINAENTKINTGNTKINTRNKKIKAKRTVIVVRVPALDDEDEDSDITIKDEPIVIE